jgi:hypothetical protein
MMKDHPDFQIDTVGPVGGIGIVQLKTLDLDEEW